MIRIAVFPGSFAPFHVGHADIVKQALHMFDSVMVVHLRNPAKETEANVDLLQSLKEYNKSVFFVQPSGLLVKYLQSFSKSNITIIKGLRNTNDFIYEQAMQYNNEDLGVSIPTMYFIAARKLTHISSSSIKAINAAKGIK